MQARDKINKAVLNQFEATRDVIEQNLLAAVRSGHIVSDSVTLEKIISLISQSLFEGYHKGNGVLMREIDAVMTDVPNTSKQKQK